MGGAAVALENRRARPSGLQGAEARKDGRIGINGGLASALWFSRAFSSSDHRRP